MPPYRTHLSAWAGAAGLVALAFLGFLAGWRAPASQSVLSASSRPAQTSASVPIPLGKASARPSLIPNRPDLPRIILRRYTPAAIELRGIQPEYRVADLGSIGPQSNAAAINNSGVVVGSCEGQHGNLAFLWKNGRFRDLGFFSACAINDRGVVAGFKEIAGGRERPVLRLGARSMRLALPPGSNVYAYGVNNRGEVIGNSLTGASLISHAFVWAGRRPWPLQTASGFVGSQANAINAGGLIVGSAAAPGGTERACLWQHGRMVDLGVAAKGYGSQAESANNRGQVVGSASLPAKGGGVAAHAFLWQHGRIVYLGTIPGWQDSYAAAINDRGEIVGSIERSALASSAAASRAVLWRHGRIIDLNRLIRPNSGWVLEEANAINDRGEIVGSGVSNGEHRAFLLIPLNGRFRPLLLANRPKPKRAFASTARRPGARLATLPAPAGKTAQSHFGFLTAQPRVSAAAYTKKLHAKRLVVYERILRARHAALEKKTLRLARERRDRQPPPLPIGFEGIVVGRALRPDTYEVQDGNINRDIYFGPHSHVRPGEGVRVRGVLRLDGTVAASSVARVEYGRVVAETAPPVAHRAERRLDDVSGSIALDGRAGILQGRLGSKAGAWSRKISVLADGRNIPVDVPHGIPVRLGGAAVSVHKLGHGTPLLVYGHWDDKGRFHATRIEALTGP